MRIIDAKPIANFRLELRFDNGETGIADLSSLAGRGVFEAWNVQGVFEAVSITDQGAVAWPGELDLCPDSLYLRMTGKSAEQVFPELRDQVSHA